MLCSKVLNLKLEYKDNYVNDAAKMLVNVKTAQTISVLPKFLKLNFEIVEIYLYLDEDE